MRERNTPPASSAGEPPASSAGEPPASSAGKPPAASAGKPPAASTDAATGAREAVVAEHLTVVRGGVEVLHDCDFEISSGRVTGLLGPSGCGRTTLMRALVGVQRNVLGSLHVL